MQSREISNFSHASHELAGAGAPSRSPNRRASGLDRRLSGPPYAKWDIVWQRPEALTPNPRNARTHKKKDIRQLADGIREFGFNGVIIVDEKGMILAGHARWEAARLLGLKEVPTFQLRHLSEAQKRAYVLADNQLATKAGWDPELLAIELGKLAVDLPAEGLEISLTGFDVAEIDLLLADHEDPPADEADGLPAPPVAPVTRRGDVWAMGRHRLMCGDARSADNISQLLAGLLVHVVFTDPPFNVRVGSIGGRGRIKHAEFAFASGEMSTAEFRSFLHDTLANAVAHSRPGAVHFVCMDWRHVCDLIDAVKGEYGELLNICVWAKTSAGQGSFYRSQHEFVCVFRVGDAPHRNNVELGRFGRNRSNVWTYAGMAGFGKNRKEDLASHPTVKPVQMIADALLDCSQRGDIVLDLFGGSGSTLLAAERIGRCARLLEYEPAYVDVTIARWERMTRRDAILEGDGRTFDEIRRERCGPSVPSPAPVSAQRDLVPADKTIGPSAGGAESSASDVAPRSNSPRPEADTSWIDLYSNPERS